MSRFIVAMLEEVTLRMHYKPVAMLAACLAFGISAAQTSWTSRWDISDPLAHKGVSVATDHRGNVYCAGPVLFSQTMTSKVYRFGIVSYTATGVQRWATTWHDSSGVNSAVPTGIAVDWDGNCYVCGIDGIPTGGSGSGDPLVQRHFTVVKFRQDGSTPWLTSTTSNSVYKFDSGAIILNDSDYDGQSNYNSTYTGSTDDTAVWRCAIAVQNVAGSQPRFAITGPSAHGNQQQWKTVVYVEDPTDGVKVLGPNWPRYDFGNGGVDESMAIAISPDTSNNTVYVTGRALVSDDCFTTTRIAADGSSLVWEDHIPPIGSGKWSEGLSIAIDYDGNAYATGYVQLGSLTHEPSEYMTTEISAAGSSLWRTPYVANPLNPGSSRGTSISLSFERDVLDQVTVPFVNVTGISFADGYDIATLRYNTSGVAQWTGDGSHHYAASLDTDLDTVLWPTALGAGKGNAYVLGSRKSGNYDYVFYGLTSAKTYRVSPATYGGTFDDYGRSCVTGGAGLMYFTGQSPPTASDIDFLTGSNPQTVTRSWVTSVLGMQLDHGLAWTPDPAMINADDGVYWGGTALMSGGIWTFMAHFDIPVPTGATEMSIRLNGHAAIGVREKVEIYNKRIAGYEVVSDMLTGNSDLDTVIPLKDDPKEYMDSLGVASVRVTYYGGAALTGWNARFDLVELDTIN